MVEWRAGLKYAWSRHGASGLVWLAAFNIWHLLTRLPRWPLRADPFDEEHGTETSGIRHIASLDVLGSPSARYAVHYEPSSGQLVHAQLDKLTIDAARFTFTDFGSG